MERGDHNQSFDQIEEYSVPVYELSEVEEASLRRFSSKRYGLNEMDRTTKASALKVSASVVFIVTFSGEVVVGQGCGTIIETDNNINTVISSINIIRKPEDEEDPGSYHETELVADAKVVIFSPDYNVYVGEVIVSDFHYNICVIRFQSRRLFRPVQLARISEDDNSLSLLRPHSTTVKPGNPVVIVGRYRHDLVAASGVFSMSRSGLLFQNCIELLTSTARITESDDGAPIISLSGMAFGITFYNFGEASPILPMEVIDKWWQHYKQHKELRHLSYGFLGRNLSSAPLSFLEKFQAAFPNISDGVHVQSVLDGSFAASAGLLEGDVIRTCGGKCVTTFLEVWSLMWDKFGDTVEFEVARVGLNNINVIRMFVGEPDVLYKWPRVD